MGSFDQSEGTLFSSGDDSASSATAEARQPAAQRDLSDLLEVIASTSSTNAVIKQVRSEFAAKHVTFVVARYGSNPEKDPYIRTTYPAMWMARYLFRRYWNVDPIIRAGFKRTAPFDWEDIDRSGQGVADFFDDAKAHGLGANGFLIPLTNKFNQRGILSINSDFVGSEWANYKRSNLKVFLEIGMALHRRGIKELFGDVVPPPRLSPREKEALGWVAEGKEVPDIAIITGLSEHTVRTYLKSARVKLNCGTMAQAAVKAERLSLLGVDERFSA